MPECAEASVGSRPSAHLERGERLVVAAERDEGAARGSATPRPQSGRSASARSSGGERPLGELGRRQVVALQVERGAQYHVGARVVGIERDRPLEEDDRAVERLLALRLQVEEALGEGLVGLEAPRVLGTRPP